MMNLDQYIEANRNHTDAETDKIFKAAQDFVKNEAFQALINSMESETIDLIRRCPVGDPEGKLPPLQTLLKVLTRIRTDIKGLAGLKDKLK